MPIESSAYSGRRCTPPATPAAACSDGERSQGFI